MKRFVTACLIAVVGVATAEVSAQNSLPAPYPTPSGEVVPPASQPYEVHPSAPQSYPAPSYPAPGYVAPGYGVPAQPVALYRNVKVRDARKIHPCAVPTIVEVPDPCNPCCTVCVEICAPPCALRCVKPHGLLKRQTRFDYGEYKVDVIPRFGKLIIDYDA